MLRKGEKVKLAIKSGACRGIRKASFVVDVIGSDRHVSMPTVICEPIADHRVNLIFIHHFSISRKRHTFNDFSRKENADPTRQGRPRGAAQGESKLASR